MTIPLSEIFFGGPSRDDDHLNITARRPIRELPPSAAASDTDLITAIRANDESRFESYVREHAPALTRFALDFVGTRDTAEDVVADVFSWIWEHRATWSVQGSVRGYLFGAVRHRALNTRRANHYRARWIERHHHDVSAAGVATTSPDSLSTITAQELGAILRAAIDQLPERRRTAVILRWLHGMSYAEIAEATSTTVVGVKQQLNRALKDLRAALPDYVR